MATSLALTPLALVACQQRLELGESPASPTASLADAQDAGPGPAGTADAAPVVLVPDGSGSPVTFPVSLGGEFAVSAPALIEDLNVGVLDAAFDGTTYLVAWAGTLGITASRFNASGKALDAAPIVLAPHAVEGNGSSDTPFVQVRPGGGFWVFWTGAQQPGTASNDLQVLYAVAVASDGSHSTVFASGEIVASDAHLQNLVGLGASQPATESERVAVEDVGAAAISVMNFTASLPLDAPAAFYPSMCGWSVAAPGLVAGTLSYARVGERDLLAWLARDAEGAAVVVSELGADTPPPCDPYQAPPTVSIPERLRVPISWPPPAGVSISRPVELRTVADHAVAVWSNTDYTDPENPYETIAGASFTDVPSSPPSATVALAEGTSYPGYGGPLGLAIGKDDFLLGVRGYLWTTSDHSLQDSSTPVALRLDPANLDTLESIGGTAFQAYERLERAVETPGGDFLGVFSLLSSQAAVAPILRGVPVGDVSTFTRLEGSTSQQTAPAVACVSPTCVIGWSDDRTMASGEPMVVHASATTGTVTDAAAVPALRVTTDSSADAASEPNFTPLALSIQSGRVWASSLANGSPRLSDVSDPSAPGPKVLPLSASELSVVGTNDGFFAALGDYQPDVCLLTPDAALASKRSAATTGTSTWLGVLTAVVNDAVLEVGFSGGGTLSVTPFPRDSLTPGRTVTTSFDFEWYQDAYGEGRVPPVALLGGADSAALVWASVAPEVAGVKLEWMALDSAGNIASGPHVLTTVPGLLGGFAASRDGDGMAVAYGVRTFPTDAFDLFVQRFDSGGVPFGATYAVASDLTVLGQSMAEAAPGELLVSYVRYGAQEGVLMPTYQRPQVFGRFLYGPLNVTTPK